MSKLSIVATYNAPGSGPAGLAWDGRFLWNADYADGKIFRIDARTGEVLGSLVCPGNLSGLAWDGTSLWQSLHDGGWIRAVNPKTNDFDRTVIVANHGWLSGVAWDGQQLWAVSQQNGQIYALNKDSSQLIRSIPAPVAGGDLDYYDGSLWLGLAYPMSFNPQYNHFEWAGTEQNFAIVQIDPADGREIARYPVDFMPMGLAWVYDELYLSHVRERKLYCTRLG